LSGRVARSGPATRTIHDARKIPPDRRRPKATSTPAARAGSAYRPTADGSLDRIISPAEYGRKKPWEETVA
jgi:hypothetical protein